MSESEELIYLEPRSIFDSMIIGISQNPFAIVYDLDAMISHWTKEFQDESTDYDEAHNQAWDWYTFNVLGAYFGECNPIYVSKSEFNYLTGSSNSDSSVLLSEKSDSVDSLSSKSSP